MSIRKLSTDLQLKAIRQLNENPEKIDEDLAHIKEWLRKRKDIRARIDNQWLLTFLRCCKFSLERTKEKIEMFYKVRKAVPEFFGDRDPFSADIQEILKLGLWLPLRNTEDAEPRFFIYKLAATDNKKLTAESIFTYCLMMNEILLNEDDQTGVAGMAIIYDMQGVNLKHTLLYHPSATKKMVCVALQAYPNHVKAVHFYNIPKMFESGLDYLRPFVPEKLQKRSTFIYGDNLKKLHATVPKSILPLEYGGDGGPIQKHIDYWKDKVESYRDWYKEDLEKYGFDASINSANLLDMSSEMFGIVGSFRNLILD